MKLNETTTIGMWLLGACLAAVPADETAAQDGCFGTPGAHYDVGGHPSGVAVGDLNGDGALDLVTRNWNSEDCSVLINLGDGTFADEVRYSGSYATSITLADFNADGSLDLLLTQIDTERRGAVVSLNEGDGTFEEFTFYPFGHSPWCAAVGDVNGDGALDIVALDPGLFQIFVLLNTGNGTFEPAEPLAGADHVFFFVALGDLNGDGTLDLVHTRRKNDVSVRLGVGDGTFQEEVSYAAGRSADSVALGDVDGDGTLDLVVANEGKSYYLGDDPVRIDGDVSVLLNSGDGTFGNDIRCPAGPWPTSVVLGDVNADGLLDMAVTNFGSNKVSILLNAGDGCFDEAVDYAAGANVRSVAMGDIDGDGSIDLAVTLGGGLWTGSASVLFNEACPDPIGEPGAHSLAAPLPFSALDFHSYEWINNWLPTLQDWVPHDRCGNARLQWERQLIGYSSEQRALWVYRLYRIPEDPGRPRLLFTAGQHGREWMSANTMIHLMHSIADRYGDDPDVTALVDGYEFRFIVVANPDGYEHARTVERLWRKTRSYNPGSPCVGTDPDRNWDWSWGGPGTIFDPCSPLYAGTSPFSESETLHLAQYIASIDNLAGHVEFNDSWWVDETGSDGLILWPWASTGAPTADHDQFAAIATAMAEEAESVHGAHFEVASYAQFLDETHGTMMDWIYGTRGVPSYHVNLSLTPSAGVPDESMLEVNVAMALTFAEELGATLPGPCEIDSDGDGVGDCDDACPGDPNKTSWGTCGCGVSDADRDGDGRPDCIDACPDDASRVTPDPCGCGPAANADLDGNAEIGFADLTRLLSAWGPCTQCPEDLNTDGQVGFTDLTVLLAAWGVCD